MFQTYAGVQAGGNATPIQGAKSTGRSSSSTGWEPSVLYLLGLTIAEIFAVAFLVKHLR